MLSYFIYLILLLHIYHIIPAPAAAAGGEAPAYTATDFILLNCGSSSILNDTSHRSWDSDVRSRYAPSNAASISSTSQASHMNSSVFRVPYETARVFHSPFTYTFRVLTGPKFLRLYFHPTMYSDDYDSSLSFFSVTANGFTLLSNFSASLYSRSTKNTPSFMKEFIINVEGDQQLNLTFSPNTNSSAFVNGIEIVSIPDTLYYTGDPIKNFDRLYYLRSDTAMENLYRLNVGGSNVEIQDDSGRTRGMFRAWAQDDDYISGADFGYTPHVKEPVQIKYTPDTPPHSAPPIVYKTSRVKANRSKGLEWAIPVDSGFYYLLRFHFCETELLVTAPNQRVFTIFIDNKTAEIDADIINWTGGTEIPIFRDYVSWVPDDGRHGQKDLNISLFPYLEGLPKYSNVLLNGLEIFKLSDPKKSLAAPNPYPATPPETVLMPPGNKKSNGSSLSYIVIGSVIGIFVVIAVVVSFSTLRRRRRVKDSITTFGKSSWVPVFTGSRASTRTSGSTTRTSGSTEPLPSDLCRRFSLDEIKTATVNFDHKFVIGKGGFGNVYKGSIDDGATTVAVKRLNPSSNQGVREFLTEINMLSKLRHIHLVSLIGYCNENGEMILVYDYMEHGTLRDHLYNTENHPLTWKQRLQICLGAAKGLHYLHTGAKRSIIHRDVKSTNILLDEKWVAKMSDFGLSKVGPTGGTHTHVSTVVKGSFGYVDPEYYRRQQLTDKSDVYSFGVVLFEVLCSRPAIIVSLPKEQVNLAEWAKFCYRKGTLDQIIDSHLDGQIAPECLSKFVETAVSCLRDKGIERPAMSDVVWSLEFAFQLQEAAEHRGGTAVDGGDVLVEKQLSLPLIGRGEGNTMSDEETFSRSTDPTQSKSSLSSDSEKLKPGDIFSEIKNPLGR